MKNETTIVSDVKLTLSSHTLKTYTLYRCNGLRSKTVSGKMMSAQNRPDAEKLLSLMAESLGLTVSESDIKRFSDRENGLYLWDDNGTCAIARIAFTDGKSARINTVFTSPEKRGRGYAGALVSALCEKILRDGLIPTVLADEDNPVSNKMYLSLGFIPDGKIYEYQKKDAPKTKCAIFDLYGKRN